MGSPTVGLPVDLLAPPRRRRSPRLAIVFLPFSLALVILFYLARLTLRLVMAVGVSVGTAARVAILNVLALTPLWLGGLVLWWIVWLIGNNSADDGRVQLGYHLYVYWPWQFDDYILGLLHLARPREWWGDRYEELEFVWKGRGASWLMLLTPLHPPVLAMVGMFLVNLMRHGRANVRRALAEGMLR